MISQSTGPPSKHSYVTLGFLSPIFATKHGSLSPNRMNPRPAKHTQRTKGRTADRSMRRWLSAAGGLCRRVLSSSSVASTASHARPLPPLVISKAPSAPFPLAFACRRHHSLSAPLAQGFFHPVTAPAFRPPVSSPLPYSSLVSYPLPRVRVRLMLISPVVSRSRCCSSRCGTMPRRTRTRALRSRPPSPKSRNTSSRPPRN